jgi:hypothetical protein
VPRELVGGTRLVGRRYFLGSREVEIVTGWGPGATVRNVAIRFLDDGTVLVRPFRGLTRQPRTRAAQHKARTPSGTRAPRVGTSGC